MREHTSPIHNPKDRDSPSKTRARAAERRSGMKSFRGVKYD